MSTINLLKDITRLYESPPARSSALSELLSEIKYAHASLSSDKLAYFFIDISQFRNEAKQETHVAFFGSLINLIEYYLKDLSKVIRIVSPLNIEEARIGSPTEAELELYETIYHSFGSLIMNFSNDKNEQASPMEIRIWLVLSGISRQSVYPEVVMEFYNSTPRR